MSLARWASSIGVSPPPHLVPLPSDKFLNAFPLRHLTTQSWTSGGAGGVVLGSAGLDRYGEDELGEREERCLVMDVRGSCAEFRNSSRFLFE